MEKIIKLTAEGWDIKVTNVVKRIDEWELRYCWKAQKQVSSDNLESKILKKESKWEGFITPEECYKDLINELSKI